MGWAVQVRCACAGRRLRGRVYRRDGTRGGTRACGRAPCVSKLRVRVRVCGCVCARAWVFGRARERLCVCVRVCVLSRGGGEAATRTRAHTCADKRVGTRLPPPTACEGTSSSFHARKRRLRSVPIVPPSRSHSGAFAGGGPAHRSAVLSSVRRLYRLLAHSAGGPSTPALPSRPSASQHIRHCSSHATGPHCVAMTGDTADTFACGGWLARATQVQSHARSATRVSTA